MKELMGGLWFAGFLAWAIFGLIPGTILIILGILFFLGALIKEQHEAEASQNWRKNYPSYKY